MAILLKPRYGCNIEFLILHKYASKTVVKKCYFVT